MERRTAIAASSAVSISLLSGALVVGAHFGALGFAGTPPASSGRPVPTVTAPAPVTGQSASTVAQRKHDDGRAPDDRHRESDHEDDASGAGAHDPSTTIGTHDD
jgi:hypothetical protein